MTKRKPSTSHGGARPGAGRPPKPDPLKHSITVALTAETLKRIDTDIERLKAEVPEATVERTGWVRSAIMEKLARSSKS